MAHSLRSGQSLGLGGSIVSHDGKCTFTLAPANFQNLQGIMTISTSADNQWNARASFTNAITWRSGRIPGLVCITLEANGNLVGYNAANVAVWSSCTRGKVGVDGPSLQMQDNGNLCLIPGNWMSNIPSWETNTAIPVPFQSILFRNRVGCLRVWPVAYTMTRNGELWLPSLLTDESITAGKLYSIRSIFILYPFTALLLIFF
jgi:hypothetical protein